ncbi:MAG: M23 family metallopeptidase [Desulfobacteraceae bacterium]|nr:M23 family metallopeptidase [Desulfobacteraceae bacterium]
MRKHYTILVIDDKGSPVRETLISKRFIWLVSLMAFMALSVIGAGAYHYSRLYQSVTENADIRNQLQNQQAGIEDQRRQINSFAQSINELKANLVTLSQFEQKVRIMANLEHKDDQASLFAVGGSMPEDLDTSIPLQEDHDRLIRQMHEQIGQINQGTALQQKSFETLLSSLKDKRNLLAATPSLRPTMGWISSEFGYRISPFTGRRELHKGMDIANREGTPIIAPADGVITFADNGGLMGNMISLDHGYGMLTRYGHLVKILKKKGDRVKRGEAMALMGTTGRSTGPHLHYEVRLNGIPVNPTNYILD